MNLREYKTLFILLLGLMISSNLSGQSSSLVWLNNGSLQYQSFAMEGQSNAVNVIPDYSHAGYQGGGVAIPSITVVETLSPSGGDDTAIIQQAIDNVEALAPDANGFRGAILLQAGCYEVDQLFIEESGVVLRGEGQGMDGPVLKANLQFQHDVITIQGTGSGFSRNSSSQQEITTAYVPVGAYSFDVADASGYSVGDLIVVRRTPNQTWIDELGMDEATLCADDPIDCNGWTPGSYTIDHERTITQIVGNTITINLPIVDVMETQYGGGEIYQVSVPGRIEKCGVEKLRIQSYYDPNNDEDENHAWIGVKLRRVTNSWVSNVTGQYLGYGTVSINNESNFNTVQECAAIEHKSQITGGRRYSFNVSDGVGNLFQRNYTSTGRHDYVTGSRVTGPNVFLDSYSAITYADIGPHHRWATGLLFDNIKGGQMRVQNRGSSGSGHGWAGNTTMFWNLDSYSDDIKVESPLGGRNWGIGCVGLQQNGAGFWESWNTNVLPRSLYLQQLEDRLGAQAVANVTIPEQLTGDIYDMLESWGGEGDFGVPSVTQLAYPSEDAFVRGGTNSSTNYGTDDELSVKENSGISNNDRMSFLKFDLSGITGPIYNVKLRLIVSNDAPGAAKCALHHVTDDSWSENSITWDNQPGVSTLIETLSVPAFGSWIEYNITTIANTELSGDGTLSFRLSESTLGNLFEFSSKEENDVASRPRIEYTLTPSGAGAQDCSEILPVTWMYLTARAHGIQSLLEWGTTQEENHDRFIVEHSIDGNVFSDIGEVRIPVNSDQGTNHYEFLHERPKQGINYYRLRQIDLDERYTHSEIQTVFFEGYASANALSLFPNPTSGNLQVRFQEAISASEVQVYTLTGNLLAVEQLNKGNSVIELNTSTLPAGIYFVSINGYTQKFVKN
jgi:hypothetical protein